MRVAAALILLLLALSAPGTATVLTDGFALPQSGCSYTTSAPYDGGCDVIGDRRQFDIQKIEVTGSVAAVSVILYLNFGANNLSPFWFGGVKLHSGDVLFYDPSDRQVTYGVPLTDHDGLTAGNLYATAGPLQTAEAILHDSNNYYRRDAEVWMPQGSGLAAPGSGVSVQAYGNGTADALYKVMLAFAPPAAFIAMSSDMAVQFASATCGNDVLSGPVKLSLSRTPEPSSLLLVGSAAALLLLRRKRYI